MVGGGLDLEGCDKVVSRCLVAVCLLVVCLNLFMLLLLLDDLPHFLLQLRWDDKLVVRVWLGGGVEVSPLLLNGGVGCLLYEVLVPSLAGHGAVSSSSAAQRTRQSLPSKSWRGGSDWGGRRGGEERGRLVERGDSMRHVCAWLSVCVRNKAVIALQTVDISLHFYAAAIREDAGNGLFILAVHPVVRKRSRKLPLEAPASAGGSPHTGSPRQVEVGRQGLGLRKRLL